MKSGKNFNIKKSESPRFKMFTQRNNPYCDLNYGANVMKKLN